MTVALNTTETRKKRLEEADKRAEEYFQKLGVKSEKGEDRRRSED